METHKVDPTAALAYSSWFVLMQKFGDPYKINDFN